MKKTVLIIFILINCISYSQNNSGALISSERNTINSEFLNEERTFQVYLPPSYHFSDKGNFPVVYLIDGDYNFNFDTALIEYLSNVSNKIPEMIVVGISDKGNANYKINCTPTDASDKKGNATNFMSFIDEELKPYINKNYKASNYSIVIGHSIGGLFVTNYLLENPKSFNTFIAIDPALWWGDYEIIKRADSIYKDKKELDANFYISLADTKQMGVRQFVGVLDKYFPLEENWTFDHYENENHGSVALVTIKSALLDIFKKWSISREEFYAFKNSKELITYYKNISDEFSTKFTLSSYFFSNAIYYYYRTEKWEDLTNMEEEIKQHFPHFLDEFYVLLAQNYLGDSKIEKAENLYKKGILANKNSFKSYEGLSKIYFSKKEYVKAKEESKKSIKIAKQVHVRQWQMNELVSNYEKINKQLD